MKGVLRILPVTIFILAVVVLPTLALNYGRVECSTFIDVKTGEKADCGLWKFPSVNFDGVNYDRYVAYGEVADMNSSGKDVFISVKFALGRRFFYLIRFRLIKRNDTSYEISEERLKRMGYFDNNRLISFSENEIKEIRKNIIGKDMIFSWLEKQGGGDEKSWSVLVNNKTSVNGFWLMLKGLLNMNVLNAQQAGY